VPGFSGDVSHLGERLVCNQEVAGSIPVVSTEHIPYVQVTSPNCCSEFPLEVERTIEESWDSRLILRVFHLRDRLGGYQALSCISACRCHGNRPRLLARSL
jgi:hypothetical protein